MVVPAEFVKEYSFESELEEEFTGGGFVHGAAIVHSISFFLSRVLEGR